QDWTRHYQQIAREEKESELADDLEKGLSLHMLESLCIDELQRRGASKQAISRAFDDDVEFQERVSEFVRYMAETFSRHQIDIESEE
ncbi:host-nuclease inhibitor protein Gam, partial [Salmonella enterica subsp. enterica serovar Richmond]|nr:host-nuclease inhibitor protein Gam [Salmonella enterica subsp. enterica serovar Richmond]